MIRKFGVTEADQHFLSPGDTICDATQERQDAMLQLVDESLDLVIVIGGYNSSNTGHLYEIAADATKSAYHIDGPDCIGPGNQVTHLPIGSKQTITTTPFLPDGNITIGITAGASTPDQVIAGVIQQILEIKEIGSSLGS
jgi:4-hydroxy-3-methylbut-2-en-1-yl diphosphate reductase